MLKADASIIDAPCFLCNWKQDCIFEDSSMLCGFLSHPSDPVQVLHSLLDIGQLSCSMVSGNAVQPPYVLKVDITYHRQHVSAIGESHTDSPLCA